MAVIQQKGIRRYITSPLACFLLLLIAGVLLKSIWGLYFKVMASADARERSEKELTEIIERKQFVENEIHRLRSSEGVEEEIRRKFNVVKDGEQVVVIVNDEELPLPEEEKGFFDGLWARMKAFITSE